MLGPVCLQNFTCYPSQALSAPQYAPSNSLLRNILTPKSFDISSCAQIPPILMKTRNFGVGGGGQLYPYAALLRRRAKYANTGIPARISTHPQMEFRRLAVNV